MSDKRSLDAVATVLADQLTVRAGVRCLPSTMLPTEIAEGPLR